MEYDIDATEASAADVVVVLGHDDRVVAILGRLGQVEHGYRLVDEDEFARNRDDVLIKNTVVVVTSGPDRRFSEAVVQAGEGKLGFVLIPDALASQHPDLVAMHVRRTLAQDDPDWFLG